MKEIIKLNMQLEDWLNILNNKLRYVKTGTDLDNILDGGLCLGYLYLLAAPTGGNKSRLSIALASNLLKYNDDIKILFIGCEQTWKEVITMTLASTCNISEEKLRRKNLSQLDISLIKKHYETLNDRFYFANMEEMNLANNLLFEKYCKDEGISVIFYDYLGANLDPENGWSKLINEAAELSKLAKNKNLCVFVTQQTNKSILSVDNTKPVLLDQEYLAYASGVATKADYAMIMTTLKGNSDLIANRRLDVYKHRWSKLEDEIYKFHFDADKLQIGEFSVFK